MEVEIIPYSKNLKDKFYELNIEWLQKYFYVEKYDEEVLSKPEVYILEKGGFIFFARTSNMIIGTVALMPHSDRKILELTKMAVMPSFQGNNVGQKLMEFCIQFSKLNNVEKLILYSNKKLANAIHIYKKYGFKEIPVEKGSPYLRSDIKMELRLDSN